MAMSTALGHLSECWREPGFGPHRSNPIHYCSGNYWQNLGHFEQDGLNTKKEFPMLSVEFWTLGQFVLWKGT